MSKNWNESTTEEIIEDINKCLEKLGRSMSIKEQNSPTIAEMMEIDNQRREE